MSGYHKIKIMEIYVITNNGVVYRAYETLEEAEASMLRVYWPWTDSPKIQKCRLF